MNRENIDKKYKWDLSKIYGSSTLFDCDYQLVIDNCDKLSKYKSIKLDSNSLYCMLKLSLDTSRIIEKMYAYVSLLCDIDTSNNDSIALKEKVVNLYDLYNRSSYFIDSKILKLSNSELNKFYKENNKLLEYKIMIDRL